MQRAGIYQVRHAQLFNIAQTLEIGMLDQVEHQLRGNADKPVNRVVYDLLFIQWCNISQQMCQIMVNTVCLIVNFC